MNSKQGEQQDKRAGGVSRRRLLKLLAATGVAVGVDRLMPSNWITPAASVNADSDTSIYPGNCSADDLPVVIINSTVAQVHGNSSLWRLVFAYNDTGGFLTNSAALSASILKQGTLYNNMALNLEPNGHVIPQLNTEVYIPCASPDEAQPAAPNPVSTVTHVTGLGEFYFSLNSNDNNLSAVDEDIVVSWTLTEPDDRSTPTELTTGTPTAVSLSDFVVNSADDGAKGVAAAGAAAALGVATAKVLRNSGEEEATDEA